MSEFRKLKVEHGESSIATVTDAMFGGNILFNRNELDLEAFRSPFDDAVNNLSLYGVRYPGGTITEKYFDLANPDNRPAELSPTTPFIGLTDFLVWCAVRAQPATLVLPTHSMVIGEIDADGLPRELNWSEIKKIQPFLLGLLADTKTVNGQKLSENIAALEIGNEYFADGGLTAVEYGLVANAIATEVQEVFSKLGLHANEQPKVLVQMANPWSAEFEEGGYYHNITALTPHLTDLGVTQSDILDDGTLRWLSKVQLANDNIIDQIDTEIRDDLIDGLVQHYYYKLTNDQFLDDPLGVGYISTVRQIWEDSGFESQELHITEWNVHYQNESQLGLKGASALLHQFESMLSIGVDAAHAWPVQHWTTNDLAGGPFSHSELSPIGAMFKLLSQNTVDLELNDVVAHDEKIEIVHFSGSGTQVFFVGSRSNDDIKIALDIGDFVSELTVVDAVRLGINPSSSNGLHFFGGELNSVLPFEEHDVYASLDDIPKTHFANPSNIQIDLAPYEIIMIRYDSDSNYNGLPGDRLESNLVHPSEQLPFRDLVDSIEISQVSDGAQIAGFSDYKSAEEQIESTHSERLGVSFSSKYHSCNEASSSNFEVSFGSPLRDVDFFDFRSRSDWEESMSPLEIPSTFIGFMPAVGKHDAQQDFRELEYVEHNCKPYVELACDLTEIMDITETFLSW